jgi:hypothetical protein
VLEYLDQASYSEAQLATIYAANKTLHVGAGFSSGMKLGFAINNNLDKLCDYPSYYTCTDHNELQDLLEKPYSKAAMHAANRDIIENGGSQNIVHFFDSISDDDSDDIDYHSNYCIDPQMHHPRYEIYPGTPPQEARHPTVSIDHPTRQKHNDSASELILHHQYHVLPRPRFSHGHLGGFSPPYDRLPSHYVSELTTNTPSSSAGTSSTEDGTYI